MLSETRLWPTMGSPFAFTATTLFMTDLLRTGLVRRKVRAIDSLRGTAAPPPRPGPKTFFGELPLPTSTYSGCACGVRHCQWCAYDCRPPGKSCDAPGGPWQGQR